MINQIEVLQVTQQKMQKQVRSQFIQCEKVIQKEDLKTYLQAIQFSKLKVPDQIDVRNVLIYQQDYIHEIYTKNQNQKLPHMLMIHGYGGTGLTFVRLFQKLYDFYQIHSVDAFGIGYSSRGNWKDDLSPQEVQHYFVDSIEQWRKTLKIQKFQIVGHSFGGYLATIYAKKYPQRISRLILLSPVGFTSKTEQQLQIAPWFEKARVKFGSFFYNLNVKPSSILKNCLFGKFSLQMIVGRRLKLQGKQKQLWKTYFSNLIKEQTSSQHSFYVLFAWPLIPVRGDIMNIIKSQNFKFKIEVYYGDRDWMDLRHGAYQKIIKQFESQKVLCQKISNADHQLIMDNPVQVGDKLIRHYLSDQKNQEIKKKQNQNIQDKNKKKKESQINIQKAL